MSPAATRRLKALESAPLDSWIVLSKDESRIIAVGSSYREAAEAACEEDTIILKTPPAWGPLSL